MLEKTEGSIKNGHIGTTSCGPKNILQMVKQQCNGKHLCRVTEPDEDPCPGTTKYFKISYDNETMVSR
jgi:hypothetical protein